MGDLGSECFNVCDPYGFMGLVIRNISTRSEDLRAKKYDAQIYISEN